MNYLEGVKTLLTEYLEKVPTPEPNGFAHEDVYNGREMQNCSLICANGDYNQRVYDFFFNFITDPTQSPESILHLLETYISGLDGFSTNKAIQTLVAFPCLEALAKRRPEVLEGPWEKVAWIIIKYSSSSNTVIGKWLADYYTVNVATLTWIFDFASPELCPNPCLRLELFRLMRGFNFSTNQYWYSLDFHFDPVSFRNKIINTLFELCENYTSLTVDQLPNFNPMELQFVMLDNHINMEAIMVDCDLYLKRSEIIVTIFKLTSRLALLAKERQMLINQGILVQIDSFGFQKQLSACLSFCGLLPHTLSGYSYKDEYLICFVKAIGNDPILLNNIMCTLDTITEVSLCFPENEDYLPNFVTCEKEKLLHRFFKKQISQTPAYQYLHEIRGGFSSSIEYRLRYFQSNKMNQYQDSDNDSECYSDENHSDDNHSDDFFSEMDFSDD